MKKRIFSLILTLILCVTMFPTISMAASVTDLSQSNVSGGTLSLVGGESYKLTENIEISKTIEISGNITLDLNGFVLKMTGNDSVIKVNVGAHLIINDSTSGNKHYFTVDNGLYKWINNDDISGISDYKEVSGGIITGGTTESNGGGIYLDSLGNSYGTVTINGGNIVGCQASNGGGLFCSSKFTMNGGKIIGCKASNDGGIANFALNPSTISGGSIEYCTAGNKGGGIYNHNPFSTTPLTISGVKITKCKANSGGGIYATTDSLLKVGGDASKSVIISDNTSNNEY